jgi:cobalt-zinc-cadmium efflux system membrane fusion protein
MNKMVLLTVAIVLPLGLIGGGAATYYWLQRHGEAGHARAESSHGNADPQGRREHAGEAGHAERGEHDEGRIRLSDEAVREFGVETAVAAGGRLDHALKLPGEVVLNADRVAHIVPRVSAIVREVRKNIGDNVDAGEVMAVMESRELAEARAADLSAEARLKLAESTFKRVNELVAQKISPQKDYYEAQQKLEEAQIQHRETEAKLQALGVPHDQLTSAPDTEGGSFSRYEITAPFPATVVEKHAAMGEVHDASSDMFVLADLSTVWVDITLYPQDAARVRAGSKVRLSAPGPDGQAITAEGTISYVSPVLRESTRTGLARAVIANDGHIWRPGLFVTAEIVVGQEEAAVLVPNDAIQMIEDRPVVFVAENGAFEKRAVVLGRSNDVQSQVVSGLKPGERYVSNGAFILKAELSKGTGGHEH